MTNQNRFSETDTLVVEALNVFGYNVASIKQVKNDAFLTQFAKSVVKNLKSDTEDSEVHKFIDEYLESF